MAPRDVMARLDLAVQRNRAAAAELEAAVGEQEDVTKRLRLAANELKAQQARIKEK